MIYYFCHCMSLHVCPGEIFILDRRLAIFFGGKKLSFWLSACSVLIVCVCMCVCVCVFALIEPFFPFGAWTEGVR